MTPNEFIKKIKSSGVDFKTAQNGRGETEVLINCVFCETKNKSRDTEYKLSVNAHTEKWQCFRCESHGSNASRVFKALKVPYHNEDGIIVTEQETYTEEELEPECRKVPHDFFWFTKKALSDAYVNGAIRKTAVKRLYTYLREDRGLNHRLIKLGRFGCVLNDPNRLYIPVFNYENQFLTYQMRMLSGNGPKYLSPPKMVGGKRFLAPKECLFGEHRYMKYSPVILCEGAFDSIWFPNGLATFGKTLTSFQLNRLLALDPPMVYLGYDEGTPEETYKVRQQLSAFFEVQVITPKGKDFDLDFRNKTPNPGIEQYMSNFY